MMCNNQKGFPIVFAFAMVTLLSCCFSPVSSYFTLPRVSRTRDAIIIDYEGVGYSPFSLGRVYGQFVDPGFVPLPALNPYGMFYGGWSHFGRQIAPPARSEISDRAIGGTAGRPFPFLVVLRKSTADPNVFFCSGTLISDSRVLLAAQCLEQMSVYDISKVLVFVGLSSTTGTSSYVQMTRRISKVVIHAQYNAANYANDIAIISLDRPVVFSNNVAAARLPTASTDPDQFSYREALVMGWGPAAAGAASTTFRQGLVMIAGRTPTMEDLFQSTIYVLLADVGGPVVLNTAAPTATSPVWTVNGINSYTMADACTAPPRTGLKIRVSAFSAWIATYMV